MRTHIVAAVRWFLLVFRRRAAWMRTCDRWRAACYRAEIRTRRAEAELAILRPSSAARQPCPSCSGTGRRFRDADNGGLGVACTACGGSGKA